MQAIDHFTSGVVPRPAIARQKPPVPLMALFKFGFVRQSFAFRYREGHGIVELPDGLATALRVLVGAVDRLEAAAERRVEADAARVDLEAELSVMAEDRARLARDLDGSLAHADSLATASAEVSRRLDRVSETIQAMLAAPAAVGTPPDARS